MNKFIKIYFISYIDYTVSRLSLLNTNAIILLLYLLFLISYAGYADASLKMRLRGYDIIRVFIVIIDVLI